MAAMIVRIDMEAMRGKTVREARVAPGVLGKAVVDLYDSARWFGSFPDKKIEPRAGRRSQNSSFVERHGRRPSRPQG